MPRFDDATKARLNTAFAERLERIDPPTVDVLVETQPGRAEQVAQRIAGVEGLQFQATPIIANRFIPAVVPEDSLPQLTRVEGVEMVHQDQPVAIAQAPEPFGDYDPPELPDAASIPFLTPENDPIRDALSDALFEAWTPEDTFVGRVKISEVEVPRFNFAQVPPGDPSQIFFSGLDVVMGTNTTGRKYLPTSESVDYIRDSTLTDGADGSDSRVAVIDTGHTPTPEANGTRMPFLFSAVPSEPPFDYHGHGSWCTNTAVGKSAPSTVGTNKGVAPGAQYGHFKALNTFPGFGRTSWILRCMEQANAWGADVISMSLGGAQQGPITEDPFCTFIRDTCKENAGDEDGSIYVIAAGNSGPGAWTIGSPGVSEKAITVGSWSLTDEAPAIWSSRGPQGDWYDDHREEYANHRDQFGSQEFVKPDIAAPGGGRENQAKMDEADEFLQQTEVGWMEGLFDGLKDGRGYMHGTSQATPHAAGLIARLYEAGIVQTAADVKQVARQQGTIPEFGDAAENANRMEGSKNVAIGYASLRESLFDPDADSNTGPLGGA